VNRQARRWAAAAALLLLVAGGTLAYGQASGTFALFTAETKNPNAVFQGSWIPPIQSQTSALVNSGSYSQVQLSWSLGTIPPSGNPVTGYSLEYAPGGTGGSASCGTYAAFSTPAGSPVNVTGTDVSQWWCFRIHATSATVWTSATVAFTPRRLYAPTTITLNNGGGGTAGTVENGDTIAITFNQAPSNPGTISVQVCTSGNVEIGSGACGTAGSIGTITGLGSIARNITYNNSTSAVGSNTLTITLGGASNGTSGKSTVSGSGSYTAGSGATSSGGQQACTAGACAVSTSGDF
jgi:hypothetical protein